MTDKQRPPYEIALMHDHILRLEQECEELKDKFQDMKKSRDIALKEYNEEFEYKRQITVEHLEQKKELLKQLDQLKAENEELKNKLTKSIFEDGKKQIALDIAIYERDQLKQALEEIKEIAEANTGRFPDGTIWARPEIEQILEKCEVIDAKA